jgi:hypothetical protein
MIFNYLIYILNSTDVKVEVVEEVEVEVIPQIPQMEVTLQILLLIGVELGNLLHTLTLIIVLQTCYKV